MPCGTLSARTGHMMGLANRLTILWLQVHSMLWRTISLGCNRLWEAPRRVSVRADSMKPIRNVPLKVSVHLVLPLQWDQCWLVDGHCCGVGVNMKLLWLTLHECQWVMFAHIGRCNTIVVKEPFSQCLYIPLHCGQSCG